jgi:hypothetical protein
MKYQYSYIVQMSQRCNLPEFFLSLDRGVNVFSVFLEASALEGFRARVKELGGEIKQEKCLNDFAKQDKEDGSLESLEGVPQVSDYLLKN